jgi:6-pyruvoyltetrahydropterin/6-carboxytetrahydropterin synthase
MFEVGLSKRFRARHVMPGVEGPEGRPHFHDYRIEVVITTDALGDRGMVIDLDVLDAALEKTVSTVRGQDLETIRPPDTDAVTVEVLARWAHGRLSSTPRLGGDANLSVRVWESPEAFGGYSAPLDNSP